MTKHENTNETSQLRQTAVKCRFFAQYLGQDVFCGYSGVKMKLQAHHCDENFYNKTKDDLSEFTNPNPFLELKPLSKITDEDAIEISKIFGWNHYSDESKISQVRNFVIDCSNYHSSNISSNENFNLIDFLRSKGYALPFMEYSVDELVSFGWVRLS